MVGLGQETLETNDEVLHSHCCCEFLNPAPPKTFTAAAAGKAFIFLTSSGLQMNTANKHIIDILWAVKTVTVRKVPPFSLQHTK